MNTNNKQPIKYYIADTHFGHKNAIEYDNRPWSDITAMRDGMVKLWNDKVRKCDEVYILGDFCWKGQEDWISLLTELNGRKFLIPGNHDPRNLQPEVVSLLEEPPTPYKVVKDSGYMVIMSHYPMISYLSDTRPTSLMFHGHVHDTLENKALKDAIRTMQESSKAAGFDYQARLYNCWCGFYGWAPATLEEVISNENSHL